MGPGWGHGNSCLRRSSAGLQLTSRGVGCTIQLCIAQWPRSPRFCLEMVAKILLLKRR